jgi:hypothetical protein
LFDLVTKRNTTWPLVPDVQKDVERLRNIRYLAVALMLFGAAPAHIWTEFSKPQTLTIALYPFEVMKDIDHLENEDVFMPQNPESVRPQRGTWHGKRADWVASLATKSLEAAIRGDPPNWTIPRIEVVVRKIGNWYGEEVRKSARMMKPLLGMITTRTRNKRGMNRSKIGVSKRSENDAHSIARAAQTLEAKILTQQESQL